MTKHTMDKAEIEKLLTEQETGHLATMGPEGPYLVPLHFIYRGDSIYFHCGPRGRKLTNIKTDPRVCFQVEEMTGIIPHEMPCRYNTRYTSVIVEGTAEEVTDPGEKVAILNELALKYKKEGPFVLELENVDKTVVVKIVSTNITGKKNS
jgi:uncharacterized protein